MPDNLISSPAIIYQLYHRKLGAFGSSTIGNDLYYLKEFVDLGIQDFGEDRIVEMLKADESKNSRRCRELGENWKMVSKRLKYFDIALNKSKGFYDKVEKKDFSKIDDKDVKNFLRLARKISLIKQDIYTLAIFLIKNSPLQKQTIPSEAWKILEHTDMKKLDIGKRVPQPINTQNESSRGEN